MLPLNVSRPLFVSTPWTSTHKVANSVPITNVNKMFYNWVTCNLSPLSCKQPSERDQTSSSLIAQSSVKTIKLEVLKSMSILSAAAHLHGPTDILDTIQVNIKFLYCSNIL